MKKNLLITWGVVCVLVAIVIAPRFAPQFKASSPVHSQPEMRYDYNLELIKMGRAMIGDTVKPGQTLIHVIRSPSNSEGRGEVCFVFFNTGIGDEYVIWNPLRETTTIYHSNRLIEYLPSDRTSYWEDAYRPHQCEAGHDDSRDIVRWDILH